MHGEQPEISFASKDKSKFRVFDSGDKEVMDRIRKTYKDMHTNQTVEFVKQKVTKMPVE